ncbi:hypothetical protein AVEN_111937-1 [Araneus ventricosus]|uniref:Uncharacterized protein n=1 Tax=Araneus ventricosus TaxID=182803 RepID=A0A4Y2L281_ARAVE|nr:hypothetical protein AVEN_111937-1 [Araneus ventricosus]
MLPIAEDEDSNLQPQQRFLDLWQNKQRTKRVVSLILKKWNPRSLSLICSKNEVGKSKSILIRERASNGDPCLVREEGLHGSCHFLADTTSLSSSPEPSLCPGIWSLTYQHPENTHNFLLPLLSSHLCSFFAFFICASLACDRTDPLQKCQLVMSAAFYTLICNFDGHKMGFLLAYFEVL